ncbi:MAG: hypothetical protein ABR924_17440 [Terracidiphilus sp.]
MGMQFDAILEIEQTRGGGALVADNLGLSAGTCEKFAGAFAEPAVARDAEALQPGTAINLEIGDVIAGTVQRLEIRHARTVQTFQQVSFASKMRKVSQLAYVNAGKPATVHVKSGNVAARLVVPRRPARPKDQPRRRRKGNWFPTLHSVIPVENANRIFGRLDSDAAGGADGHELHGFFAGEKQVCVSVRAGGHIPGREAHARSIWTTDCERQAGKRRSQRANIPRKEFSHGAAQTRRASDGRFFLNRKSAPL